MRHIRSHYDNLKVARDAPIEVIEAAYVALYAKYNPDLNPYNEKVAGITRIIKRSYDVLSDPARRAAHDRWIAESEAERVVTPPVFQQDSIRPPGERISRIAKWTVRNGYWAGAALILSCLAVAVLILGGKPSAHSEAPVSSPATVAAIPADAPASFALTTLPTHSAHDSQVARGRSAAPRAEQARETSQPRMYVGIPAKPRCARPAVAPDGQPWPATSGYVSGSVGPIGHSTVTADNSQSRSDMLVKLFVRQLERPAATRVFFLRAHEQFTLNNVAAGEYDIRYQDLDSCTIWKSEPFSLEEHQETIRLPDRVNRRLHSTAYSLTLYEVPNGNTQPEIIGPDDF